MAFRIPAKRILVIKNRAIGDTILLTGPLRLLRKHKPLHQIHVLVRSPAGDLLEGLPYVDRVISAKEPDNKVDRAAYWMRMVRRLREQKYEYVLNFHASFRTALVGKMLRAKTCIANNHSLTGKNWFSDLKVPGRGCVKSIIDRDLDVLRAMGIQANVKDAMPEIVLSTAEKNEAKGLLSALKSQHSIFLGIGGSRETKRWTPENFIGLMQQLHQKHHAQFVMATVPSDEPWLQKFQALLEQRPELQKQLHHFKNLPLRQTAGVISQCHVYVGNDSGLKHLAVALGLKTFTFFGPENPTEWHPYDLKNHPLSFIQNLTCRTEMGKHWCPIPVCHQHHHRCMRDITPESVLEQVSGLF